MRASSERPGPVTQRRPCPGRSTTKVCARHGIDLSTTGSWGNTIPVLYGASTRLHGTGVRGGVLVRGKQRGSAGGRSIAGKMYLVLFVVNCTVSSESILGDLSGFLAFSQVR